MKWDAVEREFMILSKQFSDLSKSFRSLALELSRERAARGTLGGLTRDDPPGQSEKDSGADQAPLSFS